VGADPVNHGMRQAPKIVLDGSVPSANRAEQYLNLPIGCAHLPARHDGMRAPKYSLALAELTATASGLCFTDKNATGASLLNDLACQALDSVFPNVTAHGSMFPASAISAGKRLARILASCRVGIEISAAYLPTRRLC